jgi:hypothetical protein
MTSVKHRPQASHAAQTHRASSTSAASTIEADIKALRKKIDGGDNPDDVLGKLPNGVAAYEKTFQHKAKDYDSAGVTGQVTANGKTFYLLNADNEGNGYTDIVSDKGKYVTGYSYSESEGPNWQASPAEAKRENAVGGAASNLFKLSALGTKKLDKFEVKKDALPQKLQDQVANHNVKAENFYKTTLGGHDVIADYVLYSGAKTKKEDPKANVGDVTIYDAKGDWLGSADINNNSKDKLKFNIDLGREE